MANNTGTNVRVGSGKVGGYLFSAPSGSTAPTDSTTALDASFVGLGYVGSDGITRSVEVSTEDITDMNLDVVRTVQTETSVQLSCTLIEVNADMLKELYGAANVTVTPATPTSGEQIAVAFTGDALPRKQYAVELVDGANTSRFFIEDGQVITPGGGEVVFVKGQAIQHALTVRAYRATNGKYFEHFTDNGEFSAA